RRALEVDSTSRETLSAIATLHLLRGENAEFEELQARLAARHPMYAGLLTTAAEIAAQQRQYGRALELAEEATRTDPVSWEAWGTLGLNQFRLGRIAEARSSLERSFTGDPYNVWIK